MPTPTFSPTLPFSLSILLSLVASANAQVVVRRRRSVASRIIAGVVVGVFCLILLTLFCLFVRRRRRMRTMAGPGIIPVSAGPSSKPTFGGPWGRHNYGPPPPPPQQQSFFGPGNNANHTNAPAHPHSAQQPYNPEYPPATGGPAPPPPYRTEGSGMGEGEGYAPPPGPPPPAHTTGNDGNFVGGFR